MPPPRASSHSFSVIAAMSERVGILQVNRFQWFSVIVGRVLLSRSVSTVIAESGFAAFTSSRSSTSPSSGTAHSCRTTPFET
jgi:hypothetical protein